MQPQSGSTEAHQVRDFRTRWHRVLNHALHHLCGSDHKQPCLLGTLDEEFLREGHTVQAQLHAEITTCHHECLGLRDDALDVGEGLQMLAKTN